MKVLRILFTLICFVGYSQEQITLSFSNSTEILKYQKGSALKIPININIEGSYFPNVKDEIVVSFITNIEELNSFLKTKKIAIDNSKIIDSIVFKQGNENLSNLSNVIDSILKNEKKFTIKINTISKSKFLINKNTIDVKLGKVEKTIFLEKKDNPEEKKNYNFYIGTNFDFKDKFQANSFYSEIDVFLPNLFFKNTKGKNYGGLRAGIFKNNSVSSLREFSSESGAYEIVTNDIDSDSITFTKKRVIRTPKVTYENIGLYFEVLFEISSLRNKNFQAFIAPHFEVIQRTETTEFETEDFLNLGKETIHRDSISTKLRSLFSLNRERTRRYYNSYFGVGLPMRYSNSKIEVFLNPIIGFGDSAPLRQNTSLIKSFGAFQFYMKEKKHGIKLSGDIRKYLNANQDPFIVINLSKSINIESLLDSDK